VLIAKLLSVNPAIMLMDEPTRGIDVGAKSEIHRLLRELANQGIGIIMISSELPEVIGMCDRVLVMHEGTQSGILTGDDIRKRKSFAWLPVYLCQRRSCRRDDEDLQCTL
jgi:ribose transport system ATP-binding protein